MKLSTISNGTVQWRPGQAEVPVTKETKTEGSVPTTIISGGHEAKPACFEVTFFISLSYGAEGMDRHMHLTVQVPAQDSDQSYSQIEAQAARKLPDALRSLADDVEQDIDRAEPRQ